ncbi:MAG: hypothetical protein V1934_05930 [Methanobacteriota archaeon]
MNHALALKILVFAVIAPLAMLAVSFAGFRPAGFAGYMLLTVLIGVWNVTVIRHLWTTGPKVWQTYALAGAMVPVFLCWTLFHPVLFKYTRAVLLFTFFVALVMSVMASRRAVKRGLRHYFVPVYNALGMGIMAIWLAQEGASGIPSFVAPLGYASGLTQALNYYYLAFLMPFLFLPPILLKFESEDKPVLSPRGKISIQTVGWGVGKAVSALSAYIVGFVLISVALGAANISSFSDDSPDYQPRPEMKFAIVSRSFTAEKSPISGWRDEVALEISAAKEMGLDFLRYDIRSEMVESTEGIAALQSVSDSVRAEGMGLMLGLYGRADWPVQLPSSFDAYCAQITADTLAVAPMADYVLPYYEPNGQAGLVLGHAEEPDVWAAACRELTMLVKNESSAKVMIEIAIGEETMPLIEAVQQTGVDAIGLDIYPQNWDDMGAFQECAAAVDRSLVPEVWLSEFGMECSMFGEDAQATFIKMAVAEASRLNLTGCCLWALQDDTGLGHPPYALSHFGIVYADWKHKPGFDAYAEAIAAVRS